MSPPIKVKYCDLSAEGFKVQTHPLNVLLTDWFMNTRVSPPKPNTWWTLGQTWRRTAPSALCSNTAAGFWTSVWAHSAGCGSAGPGRSVTRTGPGQWGRACGSVGCGGGGTPPGGQSGLGSTWLSAIKMTEQQSGFGSERQWRWSPVWKQCAHRPRGGTGWHTQCASCWAPWLEQVVRTDRWGGQGWWSCRRGCRMGREQTTSPGWWEWCLPEKERETRRKQGKRQWEYKQMAHLRQSLKFQFNVITYTIIMRLGE